MKRLLIIVLFLVSLVCGAQEQIAHLKFKGIPIEGNYEVFAQTLIKKGFTLQYTGDDGLMLKGPFMGESDVSVVVIPEPKNGALTSVMAMIDAGHNWQSIENKYRHVVNTYKEKYGEPAETVESFTNDISSDILKLHYLSEGKCDFHSTWQFDYGKIMISIAYIDLTEYIACLYVNEENAKSYHKAIIDDI